MTERINHEIEPVFDRYSKVLILGTFPSVKSREGRFFYNHPQNRFWKVIAGITGSKVPETIEDKKKLLLDEHIAVWDVIKSCEIKGSSDSSIKNVVANDLNLILKQAKIRGIFANGAKAYNLYHKYCYGQTGMEAVKLPSTSPANAAYSLDRLIDEWKMVKIKLDS